MTLTEAQNVTKQKGPDDIVTVKLRPNPGCKFWEGKSAAIDNKELTGKFGGITQYNIYITVGNKVYNAKHVDVVSIT